MTTDSLISEAQAALDALMQEHQRPFKLTAQKLVANGSSQYTIHFF